MEVDVNWKAERMKVDVNWKAERMKVDVNWKAESMKVDVNWKAEPHANGFACGQQMCAASFSPPLPIPLLHTSNDHALVFRFRC